MNTMTRSGPSDAAAPLPRLTVCGLRLLELANVADAAGDATTAGIFVNLAYASFEGRESNVVPLPVRLRLASKPGESFGDISPSVA